MVTLNFDPQNKELAQLIEFIKQGETVILTQNGQEMARLGAISSNSMTTTPTQMVGKWAVGTMQGQFNVDDRFDEPLPDDIQQAFNGES